MLDKSNKEIKNKVFLHFNEFITEEIVTHKVTVVAEILVK